MQDLRTYKKFILYYKIHLALQIKLIHYLESTRFECQTTCRWKESQPKVRGKQTGNDD